MDQTVKVIEAAWPIGERSCGASRTRSRAASAVSRASSQSTSSAGTMMSPASRSAKSKTLCSNSSCARGITPEPSASSTSARSSAAVRMPSPATTSRISKGGRRRTLADPCRTHTAGHGATEIISIGRATNAASVSARSSVNAFGISSPSTIGR
jgi:hypothetical protein